MSKLQTEKSNQQKVLMNMYFFIAAQFTVALAYLCTFFFWTENLSLIYL